MKRNRHVISILLSAALLCPILTAASGPEEKAQAASEVQPAEQEVSLAKDASAYFMLDLRERALVLKGKGVDLRRWRPARIRVWGSPLPSAISVLTRKSALNPPERKVIKPGQAADQKDTFELEALELDDMPGSFKLTFDYGFKILIRSKSKGFIRRLGRLGRELEWHFIFPLKTLWMTLRGRNFTAIEVFFEEKKEAQALYWVFYEGIKGIIWYPVQ
jgi:hypothetical protein